MKPSNEFCVNFLKASGWLDNHNKQIKADAIDECKKIVMAECTTTCKYPFSPNCVECMSNKMEQLKEQK